MLEGGTQIAYILFFCFFLVPRKLKSCLPAKTIKSNTNIHDDAEHRVIKKWANFGVPSKRWNKVVILSQDILKGLRSTFCFCPSIAEKYFRSLTIFRSTYGWLKKTFWTKKNYFWSLFLKKISACKRSCNQTNCKK